jgi:serine/threonine protein kinase/tetratricopeptide (TPR) repeat protein
LTPTDLSRDIPVSDNHRDDDQTQSFVTLSKGTQVDHYKIISKIGAGGMGEVYLAEDTDLDRKVALKFLPMHLCRDDDCRARFTREAKAAAKLDHPNIVPVYEVGEFQNRPFYAMAHIEGNPLRDVIKQGKLSVSETIQFTMQILEGLHKAHESGVVHRDVKPGNIIIDNENRPRILDFGLATVFGEDKLTKTGSTIGTVGYMSPEQIEGKNIDHRSDIFSVGVILYEMLTGRRPFEGDNDAAVARSITDTTPEPIARYKSGTTGELQQIVDKALSKDRDLRYQHADGMLADLKRVQRGNKLESPEPQRKMLAVLPFENLGGKEDEGFADGITDAIISRTAKISELGVIARTSVLQYKGTTKRIREIGTELGVDYIIEGTILWDRSGDIPQVRIIPQLIQVSDESHIWTETYEQAMTQIFVVQANIATSIAENLGVTILQQEREKLSDRPTENIEAYQLYLAGRVTFEAGKYGELSSGDGLEVTLFERAIELDSNFALAYADLSQVHSLKYHYGNDRSDDRRKRAKVAADKALELEPSLPEGHFALGYYYYHCLRNYDNALSHFQKGQPDDPRVIESLAYVYRRQGQFRKAVSNLQIAFRFDPGNINIEYNIIETLTFLRDYQEATRLVNKSIAVHPDVNVFYNFKFLLMVHQENLSQARAVLIEAPSRQVEWLLMLSMLERDYQSALDCLTHIDREVIGPYYEFGFSSRDCMIGRIYQILGDTSQARASFESARLYLESNMEELNVQFGFQSELGVVYAGLEHREDAIREGKLGLDRMPISKDAMVGTQLARKMALIYVMVGDYEAAIELLELLLSIPCSNESIVTVSLHPDWDPLRDHPRFQALLEKYDTTN